MRISKLLFLILLVLPCALKAQKNAHTFALGESAFLLDGKPFQMISGEMHYPRVPREAWRARMKMAKAMGLNTIGTYVFWNVHEPEKDKFDFTGDNNIAEFVRIAKEEGLWVILRPSPYVCAEWEFGGYPYWLQNERGLEVRSKEKQYLNEYRKYIMQVGKQLSPLLVNHGGNILMVQIENEYGSYGNDKEYLKINEDMFKAAGFDCLLYTCDPEAAIKDGHLPGLLPAINGVDDVAKVKRLINENHGGKGPYYIAEWYPAWFDWWGTKHHTVPAQKYVPKLDSVLGAGISINMYMFHGGTTRAFMNGANYNDKSPYEPQISSYDYDAPLDEAGNATHKFMQFRNVIAKHLPKGQQLPPVPAKKATISVPAVKLTRSVGMFDLVGIPKTSKMPMSFEDLNQAYGFVLYRTVVKGGKEAMLKIKDLRDYGLVYINGKRVGTLDRRLNQDSMHIQLPKGNVQLDILVENMGRINFGPYLLKNKKGITEQVTLDSKIVQNWKMYSMPFNKDAALKTSKRKPGTTEPVILKGSFILNKVGDTYLDMTAWGKGMVWINGHNLGKYWSIGPQQTVYVPQEWLKKGSNNVTVLELTKPGNQTLKMVEEPVLDQLK
ncbi:glycoside hydrolase family 35 protein [Mucilaginibacter aquatilis]|uniref:Beta-galactosidase n=1 Tax=Mucilaginibacter aquatilis TaxID=1517760 RepID=A0A6I4IQ83_9SPHI|nr:beta-galactosidase [Mucilaginibacter aquatilis]MVN91293.1 beta-galactosidase [Mucilaginibacter aquatilis]